MPLNPKTIKIIELTLKEQVRKLKERKLLFERTDKTPNKVTNFRDFQLGEFLGSIKMRHIYYIEKTLDRELTNEELDELETILIRYNDDIADICYN